MFGLIDLSWILISVPSILIASTVHEFAHAWTAYKLGDLTPKLEGRLTLNPLAHIDPLGFLILVVTRFIGWSKPVPINAYNFKDPVKGTALTALAGPVSNFILAGLITLIMIFIDKTSYVYLLLYVLRRINISLAIFNLIPIPPLDGSKIIKIFRK